VFDLDGTLIDSRRDLASSTNEMLESYGRPPLAVDDVAAMVGEGAKVLVERALAASGLNPDEPDALRRFRAIYDRRLLETTRLYPGIADAVAASAAHAALAVLSNKPQTPTDRLIDALGLASHFRWVIGGDAGFPRKPDPAALLHLMHQAGTGGGTTLFVGDSRIDVETARRAGTGVCLVRYGFGWDQARALLDDRDARADTPADVGRAIERFVAAT
jgi:phosphoglycolate phosphatase